MEEIGFRVGSSEQCIHHMTSCDLGSISGDTCFALVYVPPQSSYYLQKSMTINSVGITVKDLSGEQFVTDIYIQVNFGRISVSNGIC